MPFAHWLIGLARLGLRSAALVIALAAPGAPFAAPAQPQRGQPVPAREEGPRWPQLAPAQRQALAPLEAEWPSIDSARKQKWLVLADRMRTMPAEERGRISERMSDWARLTPHERGQARLRYEETRQFPAPDREARWRAYQALTPEEKKQFAERATSPPPVQPPAEAGRPDPASRSRAGREPVQAKSNLVPNPALAQPPKQIAPTVLQAAPGATTTPINRRASPPAHQQTGMPKIATTPEFVNRGTLLPRRGPQAAAVVPPAPPTAPTAPTAAARPAPGATRVPAALPAAPAAAASGSR